MKRSLFPLLLATSVLGGCHGESAQAPAPAPASAAGADTPAADARDQYALAEAITQARRVREDLEGTLARTRAAWVGHRYRWEVAFVPALCGAAGPCVVMPFDHNRHPDRPIRQGWLPRLELSAPERAALADACDGHRRCVVELSGTLAQFELSTEQPTSLTLSDVQVHEARAAAEGESWVLGQRRPRVRTTARPSAAAAARMKADVASGLG